MKYYKMFTTDTFIGIVCSRDYVTYQPQNNLLAITNEEVGQFVEYKGKLYRDTWMKPLPENNTYLFEQVVIQPITEEEYYILMASIEKNEEIKVVIPEIEPYIPETNPNITLEFVKESKINEMSNACRLTIESGFNLELHGEIYHFSLTTQDQLNLMSLGTFAQTQSLIPYHADGEEVVFYTAEEINQIIETATKLKIYQTTYFNSLKAYINALETIEDIAAIEYGIEIPDQYKSEALKVLE